MPRGSTSSLGLTRDGVLGSALFRTLNTGKHAEHRVDTGHANQTQHSIRDTRQGQFAAILFGGDIKHQDRAEARGIDIRNLRHIQNRKVRRQYRKRVFQRKSEVRVIGPLNRNTIASEREPGNVSRMSGSSLIPITLACGPKDFDYKTVKTALHRMRSIDLIPGTAISQPGAPDVQQPCYSKGPAQKQVE